MHHPADHQVAGHLGLRKIGPSESALRRPVSKRGFKLSGQVVGTGAVEIYWPIVRIWLTKAADRKEDKIYLRFGELAARD